MPMVRYENLSGKSSIDSYEEGEDFIRIEFNNGSIYLYTELSCGKEAISEMKELANKGSGLVSYIAVEKPAFFAKER